MINEIYQHLKVFLKNEEFWGKKRGIKLVKRGKIGNLGRRKKGREKFRKTG
jgi:hypothetical protein